MKRLALLIAALALSTASGLSRATTLSYTGAELLGLDAASFPSGAPTTDGTSIQIHNVADEFAKLWALDLAGLSFDTSPVFELGVTITFTRGSSDHDLLLAIGNSTHFFGIQFADNNNGQLFYERLTPTSGPAHIRWEHQLLANNIGYPAVGAQATLALNFALSNINTIVSASFGTTTVSTTIGHSLLGGALEFAHFGDNDFNEIYRIDSISLTGPTLVPEPPTTALLILGLLGAGAAGHRRKIR